MYKVGVVGDKDSILGFKAVGMSVFPVSNFAEAETIVDRLAEEQYAVIYIVEQTARGIAGTLEKYKERRIPAIIPIPGNQGSLGIGMQGVKKSVERAVGADILFRDE